MGIGWVEVEGRVMLFFLIALYYRIFYSNENSRYYASSFRIVNNIVEFHAEWRRNFRIHFNIVSET